MENNNNRYKNLIFDIKIHDRESSFKHRGADPENRERKAIVKKTGLSLKELDEVMAAIRTKF